MAVLAWGHNREQTNNLPEKAKVTSLDWFSRSNSEPSRQAINQLMKQHSRGGRGGSTSSRDRSQASTPTSQLSQNRSGTSLESRRGSARNKKSSDKPTARPSRPTTPVRCETPSADGTPKSLFQKGGLLRRKGSKMGITFATSPVVSPTRPPSSRAGLRGKDIAFAGSSPDGNQRKPSISNPFDFTHVTRGNVGELSGLGRLDESDLASQFDAIQARYRSVTGLDESISQDEGSALSTIVSILDDTANTTALPQICSTVPLSPPRPTPPPKDTPTLPASVSMDIRTSRSTENFSRPTSRSLNISCPVSPSLPSSCHARQSTGPASVVDGQESSHIKELPRLPVTVHAVSTDDDTARLLRSAPLPSPPASFDKSMSRHHRQTSSKGSLRHMSTFPSSRHPPMNTFAVDGQLKEIKEEDGLPRPHSDHDLTTHNYRHPAKRASRAGKPLEVEDWEVAIDSAWDLEDEEAINFDGTSNLRPASQYSRGHGSFIVVEQTVPEHGSLPSTPLMMGSNKATGKDVKQQSSSSLVGLGIDAVDDPMTLVPNPGSASVETATFGTDCSNSSPRKARSAYSAISHSSSQESIILSIASSIMSTQRSSVSSVSVSDYAQTGKLDRLSAIPLTGSPSLDFQKQKPARPESSCLPLALLQTGNLQALKAARPDSGCLPLPAESRRNSGHQQRSRPESITLTQDMLATFPVPEIMSNRGTNSRANLPLAAKADEDHDVLSELMTADRQKRGGFIARSPAPARPMSRPMSPDMAFACHRSAGPIGRTRGPRVSYSLFPTAGVSTPLSGLNIDSVVS